MENVKKQTGMKLILYETKNKSYDHSVSFALRYSDSDPSNFYREIYALDSGNNYGALVIRDSKAILEGIDERRFENLDHLNRIIYVKARDLGKRIAAEQGIEFVDESGLESLMKFERESSNIVDTLSTIREYEPMSQA